jgi:hypothetical protein
MPSKSARVRNEKQYEALKDKGMSKSRAAKIANSPNASSHGGKRSGLGGVTRRLPADPSSEDHSARVNGGR